MNEAAISIGYFTLAFMIYYYSPHYSLIKKVSTQFGDAESKPEIRIYMERLFGFLLFGFIPGIYYQIFSSNTLMDIGLVIPSGNNIWLWWLVPLLLFFIFNFLRPEKSVNIAFYPQVRKEEWDFKRLVTNALSWFIFLIGYEFAFRGWLFFASLHVFGFFPAVMINCAIYSLSHIPKGMGEAFGAFIMGFLFCIIAKNTGSMVIPLILHFILAAGNDLKAIAVNSEMHFSMKR